MFNAVNALSCALRVPRQMLFDERGIRLQRGGETADLDAVLLRENGGKFLGEMAVHEHQPAAPSGW